MPVMKVGPGRALLGGGGNYNDLIMGTQPIAYWPQSESSGLVARCLVNPAQNGTYNGVTLADDNTGPFGTPAPRYDGVNDYCTLTTAPLLAALNPSVGTAAIWTRVANVGVWTDGVEHHAWTAYRSLNNRMWHSKRAANNNIQTIHIGNGALVVIPNAGHAETAWVHWAMSWNAGGNLITYVNGIQDGAATPGVTAWTGAPIAVYIGSNHVAPNALWYGWLGPLAFWNRILPQPEIATLALT